LDILGHTLMRQSSVQARHRPPSCAISGLLAAFALSCSSATSDSGGGARGGHTSGAQLGGPSAGASVGSGGSGASNSAGAGAGSGGSAGSNSGLGGSGVAASGGSSGIGASGATASGASGASTGSRADGGTSGVGAGGDAGAGGGCAGKTYKLCEDFESGGAGGVPTGWTTLRGFAPAGGVGLASDQFHSGSMSLKSDSLNRGQDRVQKSLAALGATATKHWGRIFYEVGTPPPKPNGGVIHITFTALEGTTENRIVDTVVGPNGTHQWLFNIPDDSCCAASSYNWTFDAAWHCAEWNIDVATQSFHFYSDSKEVTELAFTGRAGARMSNYTSIGLGTIFFQTPPNPIVVWFDDLAIDDNRIGCQ
jgi:hypothetical protein